MEKVFIAFWLADPEKKKMLEAQTLHHIGFHFHFHFDSCECQCFLTVLRSISYMLLCSRAIALHNFFFSFFFRWANGNCDNGSNSCICIILKKKVSFSFVICVFCHRTHTCNAHISCALPKAHVYNSIACTKINSMCDIASGDMLLCWSVSVWWIVHSFW